MGAGAPVTGHQVGVGGHGALAEGDHGGAHQEERLPRADPGGTWRVVTSRVCTRLMSCALDRHLHPRHV